MQKIISVHPRFQSIFIRALLIMTAKNILTKIILSDLHLCFFYGFILSIPFQIRKRFLTEHSYFAGGFSEYATFFIYLSDILLILAVLFWAVKIMASRRDGDLSHLYCVRHAINHVSTIFKSISFKLQNSIFLSFRAFKRGIPSVLLSQFTMLKRFLTPLSLRFEMTKKSFLIQEISKNFLSNFYHFITSSKNRSLSLLLIFCLWLVVDLLLISGDYFFIGAYQTLKFLELAILFVYVYFNLTSFKRILITAGLLALSGLTQSLLAVFQYFLQRSVFGSKWLGEIVLSPELPGVAKIAVDGEKIMRAYGTFPHPNILAGFLLITIFLSWRLLTNYPQFIGRAGKNRFFLLINFLRKIKRIALRNKLDNLSSRDGHEIRSRKNHRVNNVSRETLLSILFVSLIFIQILALVLTFSRSGWLGFFVILLALSVIPLLRGARGALRNLFTHPQPPLKRGTINNVSRETLLSCSKIYFKALFFNKNTLNIACLVILTAFSLIYLWPEISSRNLSGESLVNLTAENSAYYKKELRDYPNNVSRETLFNNRNEEQAGTGLKSVSIWEKGLGRFLRMGYSADLEKGWGQDRDLAIADRLFYNKIAINSINNYPFTGTGLGAFIFQIDDYPNVSRETFSESEIISSAIQGNDAKLEFWRYQPAHNIYLLIVSEIGIAGFLIFILFIIQALREGGKSVLSKRNLEIKKNNVSRETFDILRTQRNLQYFLIAVFTGFMAVGAFDHYFWTVQQGRLEFWLILSLIAANGRNFRSLTGCLKTRKFPSRED